jgi:hypothetical protein
MQPKITDCTASTHADQACVSKYQPSLAGAQITVFLAKRPQHLNIRGSVFDQNGAAQ